MQPVFDSQGASQSALAVFPGLGGHMRLVAVASDSAALGYQ